MLRNYLAEDWRKVIKDLKVKFIILEKMPAFPITDDLPAEKYSFGSL